MDIVLFFVVISLLSWILSLRRSTCKKEAIHGLIDSLKGGIGLGLIYTLIVILVVICIRLIFHWCLG